MREQKDIRLFFALWPDKAVRDEIEKTLLSFPSNSGRLVPRYNWHMTLHFIGNTTFSEKDCLHKQAEMVEAAAFDLSIDNFGHFRKPRVFWLGCQNPPRALFDLQTVLGNEISQCEYEPETRPYAPHITVARKVRQVPDIKPPDDIAWHVDRFVLIESKSAMNGVRYEVIEEYLLS